MTDEITEGVWTLKGEGPLSGVRILDFGQYLAGPLLAMMLSDQGADVIRVDPPGGPRLRTPVNATLLRGRRHLVLNLHDVLDHHRARALIASADLVIENFRPGVADRLGIGPSHCKALSPRVITCSLPGFGADDPRRDLAAWEGVVMAAAGAYAQHSLSGEIMTGFSPLPLASAGAALEAATACVAALIARERDGFGQHIEIPLYNALFELSGGGGMSVEKQAMSKLADFAPGWFRCADGRFVNMISLWLRHTEAFLRAAGCESWITEGLVSYERLVSDPGAAAELRRRLLDLFKTRPAQEWEALGQKAGASIVMARSMAEWLAEPHAIESGTLVDLYDPELGETRMPGRAVELAPFAQAPIAPRRAPGSDNDAILPLVDAQTTSLLAEHDVASTPDHAPPLQGVRILDFTRVVAGPTAGRLLAQFGADVIKIDSSHSDQRAMAPLPLAHEYVNRGKRSIDLDLHDPASRPTLNGLLASADAVLNNFTIGVAERLGIDDETAHAHNSHAIYAYLNSYGRRGPWAGARGYAELANTATGITERSNGNQTIEDGRHSLSFEMPRWPFTDYAAGLLGAFGVVLGLYHRGRTGEAYGVETSLVRATSIEQIPYLIDYKGRSIAEPRGSASGWSPLHALHAAADGSLFIGARDDQADALLNALEIKSTDDIAAAVRGKSLAWLDSALRALDIGVHRVETLADVMAPSAMADQLGIRIVDHTERFGTVAMVGPIARLSRTPLAAGAFAKPFGTETEEIRAEALRREHSSAAGA